MPNNNMERIYIDTNIFIYFMEVNDEFSDKTRNIIKYLHDNKIEIVTSELTIAECLVKPIKDNSIELVSLYMEFLQNREHFSVIPVSKSILMESAKIRSETNGDLPDCIHLATARFSGCKHIFSNDDMKTPKDIELVKIDSF